MSSSSENVSRDVLVEDEKKPTPNSLENLAAKQSPAMVVDAATEKKLLRKLDKRIIPMVMWMCVLLPCMVFAIC